MTMDEVTPVEVVTPTDDHPPVGFVGAGSMGAPMVERLLAAGVRVHLFARRPEVRSRFGRLGAVLEPSLAAVAAAAPVVILCPYSEQQVEEIVAGPTGLLVAAAPGTVLVQHATVSTGLVRRLAEDGARREVAVLDAPISGTSATISAGMLTVLAGGDDEAIDRAEPLLATYASTVVRTGAVGSATTVKLINNLVFAVHVQTAVSAVRLGTELGVRPDDLLAAITACSADSAALRHLRAMGGVEELTEMAAPYLRKDVAMVEAVAAELGLDTGVLGEMVRTGPVPLSSR